MKCNHCQHVGYMAADWDEEVIRVVCAKLGSSTTLPNPNKVEEYDFKIKDHDFDLGQNNQYCPFGQTKEADL